MNPILRRVLLSISLVVFVFLFGHYIMPSIFINPPQDFIYIIDFITKFMMLISFVLGYFVIYMSDKQDEKYNKGNLEDRIDAFLNEKLPPLSDKVSQDAKNLQLTKVKEILEKWSKLKGHDKCFHHPEILQELCMVTGIPTDINDPCLPSEKECECTKYRKEIYKGK